MTLTQYTPWDECHDRERKYLWGQNTQTEGLFCNQWNISSRSLVDP